MNMTVTLTSSAGTSDLTGAVTFTAACNPADQVSSVKFYVDNVLQETPDMSAPYSFSWNTGTAATGAHQITATATYSRHVQNLQKSATLDVTVAGPPPGPPPPPPPQDVPVLIPEEI